MTEFASIPLETKAAQRDATDPALSAWVSANAGSGKTFVLSRRVIRLLLSGVRPGRILCLTFTKAAAAEMSNRVFRALADWVGMDDARLRLSLADMLEREPSPEERLRARTLFAASLDTPGGLKIQTIHAFCEALLHQFPLEANMSGHFSVIEEGQQQALLAEARAGLVRELENGADTDSPRLNGLRRAFGRLIELSSDHAMEAGLKEIIARREAFLEWTDGDPGEAMEPLWRAHDMTPGCELDQAIEAGLKRSVFDDDELRALAGIAERAGGKENAGFAQRVAALLAAPTPEARFRARNALWLTAKFEPRATPLKGKALAMAGPPGERIDAEIELARAGWSHVQAWQVLAASEAMFVFAEAILERYLALKRRRGLADFDDLISAARNLLRRSEMRLWVQYKLDKGIDHVLIDEAQDTSPRQWDIVNAIVADFHSGHGAPGRDRTVFAVGDEKQSIYSFQGADPRKFSQEAAALEKRTMQAGYGFKRVALHLSFRSAPDILDSVDAVFADPDHFRGLSATEPRTVHAAIRRSDPGEVRIWPILARTSRPEKTEWIEPVDRIGEEHPAELLAGRIAATIRGWIDAGERLPGRDRRLRCGDILILVRRRDAFSTAMVRRLKEMSLSVAGADRLKLAEHMAIEDLLALGRAVLMPEDDLSLAGVLKSPLFGVREDELTALAGGRDGESLVDRLALLAEEAGAPTQALAASIRSRFDRLRALAATRSPYEFYAHVLGREGGRKAMVARLGTEAADVLDAFEQEALAHEKSGAGSLESFVAALTRASPEIKREIDMKDDEVRVITVHSAKGLEAPVVFLVDPCTPGFIKQHRPDLVEVAAGNATGWLWAGGRRQGVPAIAARDAEIATAAEEEYRRLLYVGMTRAADRLIVCGWRGVRTPAHPHWHAMISRSLAPEAQPVREADGFEWLRWTSARAETVAARKARTGETFPPEPPPAATPRPDWLTRPPLPEPPLPRPMTPSGAHALLGLQTGEAAQGLEAGDEAGRAMAIERGVLTHKLLQLLPLVDPAERLAYSRRLIARQTEGWPQAVGAAMEREVFAILADPAFGALFAPGSRAEVGVAGHVEIAGRRVLVSGQIDRLAVSDNEVLIADYKTNRSVPGEPRDAPPEYVVQLGLYRALLRQIYPGRAVRCALLWTRAPALMEIGQAAMDAALTAARLPGEAG